MRISDWSSDVGSSDLDHADAQRGRPGRHDLGERDHQRLQQDQQRAEGDQKPGDDGIDAGLGLLQLLRCLGLREAQLLAHQVTEVADEAADELAYRVVSHDASPRSSAAGGRRAAHCGTLGCARRLARSEEHTSELQSLMRISYAVFCLKKKTKTTYKSSDR